MNEQVSQQSQQSNQQRRLSQCMTIFACQPNQVLRLLQSQKRQHAQQVDSPSISKQNRARHPLLLCLVHLKAPLHLHKQLPTQTVLWPHLWDQLNPSQRPSRTTRRLNRPKHSKQGPLKQFHQATKWLECYKCFISLLNLYLLHNQRNPLNRLPKPTLTQPTLHLRLTCSSNSNKHEGDRLSLNGYQHILSQACSLVLRINTHLHPIQ